jgi:hypothetical protein
MVRQGDSLRLAVLPTEPVGGGVKAEIEVVRVTNYLTKVKEPVVHCFDQTGRFTLRASFSNDNKEASSRSLTVTVLSASFNGKPACWAGKPRLWHCPWLPPEAVVDHDPRLKLEPIANSTSDGRQYRLTIDAPEPRYVVARLGTNGPILANARADGLRLFSSSEVEVRVAKVYSDGSQLVEMGNVLSPVVPGVVLRFEIFVGGILFDDGTAVKEITSADFDELGRYSVRFVRPASAQTSVCHTVEVFQDGVLIGP